MNLGHLFFTALFNVVYGQRLRDPFTMFKVFRRDCLSGLTFECNAFDFDWELVGKLVRCGLRPARDSGELRVAIVRGGQEGLARSRSADLVSRVLQASHLLSQERSPGHQRPRHHFGLRTQPADKSFGALHTLSAIGTYPAVAT